MVIGSTMLIGMPGPFELIIVFAIVLIIFGAGKLPQVGRQMGSAIGEFRDSVKTKDEDGEDTEKKDEPLHKSGTNGEEPAQAEEPAKKPEETAAK